MGFSFSGGVMEYCTFDFDELVTIEPDGFGGHQMVTSGSYTSVFKPPDPGPPAITNGARAESYTIEFLPPP